MTTRDRPPRAALPGWEEVRSKRGRLLFTYHRETGQICHIGHGEETITNIADLFGDRPRA